MIFLFNASLHAHLDNYGYQVPGVPRFEQKSLFGSYTKKFLIKSSANLRKEVGKVNWSSVDR